MSIPTLGSLSIDSNDQVVIPVTALGENASVRVDYALFDDSSPPATTSLVWRIADTVSSPSDVLTPALFWEGYVWVRAAGLLSDGGLATAFTVPTAVAFPPFVVPTGTPEVTVPAPHAHVRLETVVTYTLAAADANVYLRLGGSGLVYVTVPSNADVPFRIGTFIWLEQASIYSILMLADSGVTLNMVGEPWSQGEHNVMMLVKVGEDEWTLSGNVRTKPNGQIFVEESDISDIVITNTTDYFEATGPVWSSDPLNHKFDESAGNGRLTYTGVVPVRCLISAVLSLYAGTPNQVIHAMLGVSGDLVEASESHFKILTGTDVKVVTLIGVVDMSPGDYLSIWVRNTTSSADLTVAVATLTAWTGVH